MAAWVIRGAAPDDAESLVPLFEQLGYPTDAREIRSRMDAREDRREVFVAVAEGGIIGFIVVALRRRLVGGLRAEVQGLVVRDNWRGRGVATDLLGTAERWSLEQGCARMYLTSNVVRTGAHGFYAAHGYRVVKTQRVFEKSLGDGTGDARYR